MSVAKMRNLLRSIADARNVPAFVVFGDAALKDPARRGAITNREAWSCLGYSLQRRYPVLRAVETPVIRNMHP